MISQHVLPAKFFLIVGSNIVIIKKAEKRNSQVYTKCSEKSCREIIEQKLECTQ